MINTLQAGRFLAAMAVVFHHAVISVTAFVETPPKLAQAVLEYGYLGVDFFFVLSGFIIHFTMNLKPRPATQFAIDRLGRILLPYWPIGVALALAYTLLPSLSDSGREWSWVSTLTLFPTELPPALSVAWTLQHELVFYLLYAVLFFSNKIVIGLFLWALGIVAFYIFGTPEFPLLRMVFAPINFEFIAGVAAASLFLSNRSIPAAWSIIVATAFLLSFLLLGANRSESWLIGFSIASLLPFLCKLEVAGFFVVPRWLVFGGAASYAIYLTHNPLLSFTSRILGSTDLGWIIALALSAIFCGAFGVAYYMLLERPIMRFYKQRQEKLASAKPI